MNEDIAIGAITHHFKSCLTDAQEMPRQEACSHYKSARFTIWFLIAKITSPVTVADGEHDEIIKAEHTRQIVANIPRAELLKMANVSHFGMLQDPVQFNRALNTFLPKTV